METNPGLTLQTSYSQQDMARIVQPLVHLFKPECILLFGSLAGGTPHSEIMAYDLLVITPQEPPYDWREGKRYLKLKFPSKQRSIPYINLSIYSKKFIDNHSSPFFYFAKTEGTLVYCHPQVQFSKPKTCNFKLAYGETARYYEAFFALGEGFLEDASAYISTNDLRQASFLLAQAAVLFYRTLFFVYHWLETEEENLSLLHDRMRTLSGELMLLFDSDHNTYIGTLSRLTAAVTDARLKLSFEITGKQLEEDCRLIEKMKKIVEKICKERMDLYCQQI